MLPPAGNVTLHARPGYGSVPWGTTLGYSGAAMMLEVGALDTVTLAEPMTPSLVTLINAVPAATPVTNPLGDTEATAAFDVL